MIYNMASDIDSRKIVWICQQYQTRHSSVEVATINRKGIESLTSKCPL